VNPIGELIEVISRRAGLVTVREVGESVKTRRRRSPEQAAAGGVAGRGPVEVKADPDEPRGSLTAKLNTDTSPVPPAGTSPQDTK